MHRCTRFENPWGGSGRFLPNFGREGTTFWCFIAFLLTSFAKILEGGYTFIPPHPPLCASMQVCNKKTCLDC